MSELKISKGKWEAQHDADGDYVIFGFGGKIIAITNTDSDEDKANADLIAAAPELYAALKDVAEMLTHKAYRDDGLCARCDIEAALKKARGGK